MKSIIQLLFVTAFFLFMGFKFDNPSAANFGGPQNKQLADKGVGPIKELKLGAINQNLADKGSDIFNNKCSACHDINDVNLAPALKGVTKILSPVFIMNYLMNTKEMQQKDPYVKNLIQQWKKVPMMKDQRLKKDDARAVLEFLRTKN